MSKTSEFGSAIDSEHLSELTEEEVGQSLGTTNINFVLSFRLNRVSMKEKSRRKVLCFGITSS